MPAHSFAAEAVVLDTQDHGEADLIVTFLSLERGRATGIAKGAKRSKKRFVNKLEIFSFLNITCSESTASSLFFIHEAELHASFLHLRTNPGLYITASIIREVLLLATREGERDDEIFRLALWALHGLNEGRPSLPLLALFLLKFYSGIGYRPELQACLNCGQTITPGREHTFSHLGGGLICPVCSSTSGRTGTRLSPGTIRIMQSAQEIPLDKLHRFRLSGSMLDECLTALHQYGRHLFQRDIHAWALLEPYGKHR